MSKVVKDMTAEERQALITQIADCLKECGLGDVPVSYYRETVCSVAADDVMDKVAIKVEKKLAEDKSANVDRFKEAVKAITDGVDGVDMSGLKVEIGPGSKYKTITQVESINAEGPVDLEHKEGEVWLVDFWATWCPPCQGPMAHNQDMLTKRAADWGKNLRIIGISIDKTKDVVKKHVDDKKWTAVEHYFRASSDCSAVYGVQGVPHVLLIDTKGTIVFKGHPATRPDLEKDFDTLLAGEAITGAGTVAAEGAGGAGGEEAEGDENELDLNTCNETIDAFYKVGKEDLQKDENLKTLAKDMQRSFCVMVLDHAFTPSTGKSKGTFKNYRVLVGKQESIDALKTAMEEKVPKGSWELEMQEHPM